MSDIKKDKVKDISKKTDLNLRSKFNSFFKNDHHSFAVLKAEKLASALYMVTNFVSENDPLRTRLRTCAVDVVSCVTDPKKETTYGTHEQISAYCFAIGSMLGVAERAGLISTMNSNVLCQEYAELGTFIETHHVYVFSGAAGFDASSSLKSIPPTTASKRQADSIIKRTNNKKTSNYKRHKSRRQVILSLLDKKDKISVRDASSAIDGISEKTIQRELTAMVEEGVLLKEGERRWSVYKKAIGI